MPNAEREDALVVMVMSNGDVYFGKDKLTPDQLPDKFHERLGQGAERKVYIKADGRTKYGSIADILNSVHASGITNIAFLADQYRYESPD